MANSTVAKNDKNQMDVLDVKDEKIVMSGADMVIQSLLDNGVDTIFGYPGGAIMPVYDSLH